MSQWITDRRPTVLDCNGKYIAVVFDSKGRLQHYEEIADGEPWKPIPKCEPYQGDKRYIVEAYIVSPLWFVWDQVKTCSVATMIATQEAAERIAAIYEEVMP